MAESQKAILDTIEKQVTDLLEQMQDLRRERLDQQEQIDELEGVVVKQSAEVERMRSKIEAASKDLDLRYRRKREEIQSRLNHVLARLESL